MYFRDCRKGLPQGGKWDLEGRTPRGGNQHLGAKEIKRGKRSREGINLVECER